jgi:hypothetical protein
MNKPNNGRKIDGLVLLALIGRSLMVTGLQ